jgi:hypothetical protein
MTKIYNLIFPTISQRIISQSLITATLLTGGLIFSPGEFSAKAAAESFTNNNPELNSYAQAVLTMEPIRQEAFKKIKSQINGREIPKIACNEPNSINGLPDEAKKTAVNYCNQSQKIVQDNHLSIDRFNQITLEIVNNNALKQEIYNILLRLQKKPSLDKS